ncbi:Resolvase, N terminal domain [Clostridium amylolyticum]|uniref:Resolvase, N terminal domain n=1 Tax=Clostridium amylolyticum TaxID=1121298 RepID=A0A1M6E917_9CLOT|nr:MerR family transcriptional regulator [Clostridium amylolyticum]SHI82024.1 Resolvase, N terminal domain [Clostridium amylolyticum]
MMYYSIGEFTDLIGKTPQTLRDWHMKGSFTPHHITEGGTRYYSQEQLNHFLGIKGIETKKIIGYCRVSSHKQKDDLERQIENVKTYMIAKGYSFDVITDIGSGINVFSCRLQGKRANKAKKMIKELLESDIGEES